MTGFAEWLRENDKSLNEKITFNGITLGWSDYIELSDNAILVGKEEGFEKEFDHIKKVAKNKNFNNIILNLAGKNDSKGGYFADVSNKHFVADGDGSYPNVVEIWYGKGGLGIGLTATAHYKDGTKRTINKNELKKLFPEIKI